MTIDEIPDYNIFMMCEHLNEEILVELAPDYHLRNCLPSELNIWKRFPFDTVEMADEYDGFMSNFFAETYKYNEALFFENTFFVCDIQNQPIATCSIWKAYNQINTIQWFKTLKNHEGKGIGRALLSLIMKKCNNSDYPILLHTQPSSFRAIKLYSEFGFSILTNERIGGRINDFKKSLPILKNFMNDFDKLEFTKANDAFIKLIENETTFQF